MKKSLKYLILGVGIGLIVSSFFSGTDLNDAAINAQNDFIKPEMIANNSGSEDNNINAEIENNAMVDDRSGEPVYETVQDYVDITIPSGAGSHNIALLLLEYEIIEDIGEFESRVKELNLDKKIRAGEFRVGKDAGLDEIISIITGKK